MHARCARMMQYRGNCCLSTVRQEFYIRICTFKHETAHMVIVHSEIIRHLGEMLATYVVAQKQLTNSTLHNQFLGHTFYNCLVYITTAITLNQSLL